MKRIHSISGITISVFVFLHLFNHLYSLIGIESHIELMDKFRIVYRNIFAESLLMLAVGVQIYSGIGLFKRLRKSACGFFEKLQVWSGLYLAIFLLFHLGSVFTGRFMLDLDTNVYFGIAGLNSFPFNLFFIPYYALAIISFFGHIAAIHYKKMKVDILGLTPQKQSTIILAIGILLTLSIFYGLTNGFNDVAIPDEYGVLIGR